MKNRSTSAHEFRRVILMPVFRDWDVTSLLCQQSDQQLAELDNINVSMVLIS
jgi:hypothetical protein